MIRSYSLGIAIVGNTMRLSLLERTLRRIQVLGLLQLVDWPTTPVPELRKRIADFLVQHKAVGCPAVLVLPREETVMRRLILPLDAEPNLAKVVEYQLLNLLPAEDAAITYDYAASRQQGSPGCLGVSVFLVLQGALGRRLRVCEDLGIRVVRAVPSGVAFANYLSALFEHFKSKAALFLSFDEENCEVAGVLDQRILVWREGPCPLEGGMVDFLKTEADQFRSQARMPEDATIDVYLSGLAEVPAAAGEAFNARCHLLAQPVSFGLGIGDRVVTSREMQQHFTSLAAGVSLLKRKVPEPVNLLPAHKRVRRITWQALLSGGLAVTNCLLLTALLLRGPVQQKVFSSQLGQEISRLEPEVKKVRGVEEELNRLAQRADLLLDFKAKNAQVLTALVELSELLPQDTFVADLVLKEDTLEISGLSGQAAALPQIIENSPLFRRSEFVSAITRSTVAQDKEAYRVRMRLEEPAKLHGSLRNRLPVQSASGTAAQETKVDPATRRAP
ncbi:MAG: PilN domain-containing protein [Acidimicrobiia bacterium]|nr:PilN domain-containing protein [Acidimicrobiia bacterium]